MFRAIQFVLIVGVALFGMSAVAQATLITNGATVLFSDDFEGGTVGSLPTAYVGTWSGSVRVTDAAVPGPFQGAQYLTRGVNQLDGLATFAAQTSGLVHAEYMVYQDEFMASQRTNGAYFGFSAAFWGLCDFGGEEPEGGGEVRYYDAGWYHTGLYWKNAVWQKWELDYVPGASTYDLTIDGVTASAVPVRAVEASVDTLIFTCGSMMPIYYDAVVPEPSTFALLATGLIGLLCYAWRKRK